MKTLYLFLIWIFMINSIIIAGTYGGGAGTQANPYIISTAAHLYELSSTSADWVAGKYFEQTANIIVSGEWTPIGNSSTAFSGNYNGNGYTITGISINTTLSNQGMFGKCDGATIQKLGLIGLSISGGSSTGGLVGLISGNGATITECFTSGSVTGTYNYIGGLIGECYYNGNISNCYSRAAVATNNFSGGTGAGGLIGSFSNSTMSNCYSTGSVSGPNMNGGLIAASSGTVNNCFWDTQTSGQSSSAAGTGKTTAEMKTQSTFLDAGWSTSIWNIGDGLNDDYPYLDWQNTSGTPLPVELTSFSASFAENKVVLNWQTATEENNYGFEVERLCHTELSRSVTNWEKIGFVAGHGNSNSPKDYSFIDDISALSLSKCKYRLKQIDFDGKYEYSNVVEVTIELPTKFALEQNYPNPFNPTTTIRYSIPSVMVIRHLTESNHDNFTLRQAQSDIQVTLKVYDIIGREVATLVNEKQSPGNYEVKFDGSNLPSGIYFYKLEAGNYDSTKKLLLLK